MSAKIQLNKKPKDKDSSKKKKHFLVKHKKKENVSKLPTKSTDFSSNWKKLCQTLPPPQPKKPAHPTFKRKFKKNLGNDDDTKEPPKKREIWFDDVDEELLDPEDRPTKEVKKEADSSEQSLSNAQPSKSELVKTKSFKGLTKAIGMDCEMVGVGYDGSSSILARVSIVNSFGHEIYDKFVKPTEMVTDYRTHVSGIRPKDIHENGHDFKIVQKEVSDILDGRVLVGHSIEHDLKVLFLTHPRKMIRDTSTYKPFKDEFGGRKPSLKKLSGKLLGVEIQDGEHSSVQDAQATIRLYTMYKKNWEKEIETKRKLKKQKALSLSKKKKVMNVNVNKAKDKQYVSSSESDDGD